MAEILRDLAAQARFGKTSNELFGCASHLDRLAALAEHQSKAAVQTLRAPLDDGSTRPRADAALSLPAL